MKIKTSCKKLTRSAQKYFKPASSEYITTNKDLWDLVKPFILNKVAHFSKFYIFIKETNTLIYIFFILVQNIGNSLPESEQRKSSKTLIY